MPLEQQISSAKKILVVDDDRDFRWTVDNILNAAGYEILQAQDGAEALILLD